MVNRGLLPNLLSEDTVGNILGQAPAPVGLMFGVKLGKGVSRRDKWVRTTKVGSGNSHRGDRPVIRQWVARAGGVWPGP